MGMNPIYVTLIGSVGSGKTTIARSLVQNLRSKGYIAYYVDLCAFHGLSYVFIFFVSLIIRLLLKYKYIGNHYLTIWFNNRILFQKIYRIALLLEIPSIILIYLIRVILKINACKIRRRKCIIFIDEGLITGIALHYYFSYFTKTRFFIYYYKIATRILFWKTSETWRRIIIVLKQSIKDSIRAWRTRENTRIVDVNMIIMRYCIEKIILKYYLKIHNDLVLYYEVKEVKDIPQIAKDILYTLEQ